MKIVPSLRTHAEPVWNRKTSNGDGGWWVGVAWMDGR